MKLYYSPLACSLADHIALEEAGVSYEREAVDLKTKKTASGADFMAISPKGYVPALVLDDGEVLTENVAILDWIASQYPHLAVEGSLGRTRLLEALAFISTEIHRCFGIMWRSGSDSEKVATSRSIIRLMDLIAADVKGDYLFGDRPGVADFYLFVTLLWAGRFQITVPPVLEALRNRMALRPAVRTVLEDEGLLDIIAA